MIDFFSFFTDSLREDFFSLEKLLSDNLKDHNTLKSIDTNFVLNFKNDSYDSVTIDDLRIAQHKISSLYNPNGFLLSGVFSIKALVKIDDNNFMTKHFKVNFKEANIIYNYEKNEFEFISPFVIDKVTPEIFF